VTGKRAVVAHLAMLFTSADFATPPTCIQATADFACTADFARAESSEYHAFTSIFVSFEPKPWRTFAAEA
jgi:hypothetical protein